MPTLTVKDNVFAYSNGHVRAVYNTATRMGLSLGRVNIFVECFPKNWGNRFTIQPVTGKVLIEDEEEGTIFIFDLEGNLLN
jgi:hypothetical protein